MLMGATAHPPEIDRFVDTARRFCKWCESDKNRVPSQKLHFDALRSLADVYRAGYLLPDTDGYEAGTPVRVSKEQRKAVARRLANLPFQHYWTIRNPADFEGDKEAICGDLHDDFLDIYSDVIEGLWLFEQGCVHAAVFSWRTSFGDRWGYRSVSALHALHHYTPEAGEAPAAPQVK